MTEMAHPPHLAAHHQQVVNEHGDGGTMSVTMRREMIDTAANGATAKLYVDHHDPVIMVSEELVKQLRGGIEGVGGWIDPATNVLRIKAANADLTYQLEITLCGCWLGRLADSPA